MKKVLVVSADDILKNKSLFEVLAPAAVQAGMHIRIVAPNAGPVYATFKLHKKISVLFQQQKIHFEAGEQDVPYYVFLDKLALTDIPTVLQAATANETMYALVHPNAPAVRLFTKIWLHSICFLTKLITPLPYRIIAGIAATPEHPELVSNIDEKAAQAYYTDLLYGKQPVQIETAYPENFQLLKYFFRIMALAISMRWYWFVRQPITELKTNFRNAFSTANASGYRLLFVLLAALCLVGMPYLSQDYGITWDEKIQHDYGKEIIKYFASGRRDTTLFDQTRHLYNTMLFYGCSFDVLTGYVHKNFIPETDIYTFRHIVNALFGVVALLYTGLIGRWVGSWRTALLAFLFALLTPSFFGHSMNNPKDIPFATAYVFALYYLLRLCRQLPHPTVSSVLYTALGIGWAISIRAGGLVMLPYTLLFVGSVWAYQIFKKGIKVALLTWKKVALSILTVCVVGYFSGLILWPYGQRAPLENPWKALKNLSKVNYLHTYENFSGKRIYMSEVPWNYVPEWIAIGAPLFIHVGLVLALFGVFFWIRNFTQRMYLLALLFLFVFPIALVIVQNSMLYNGWRHFLFVYLSLVWLAAIGWEYALSKLNFKWLRLTLAIILLGLIVNVVAWMVRNHPNQYIYINELVGGVKGSYGDYELDYYSNTVKQAVEWLLENEDVKHRKIKLCTNNELLTVSHLTEKLADSIQVVWTRDYERYKQDWDYAIFTSRTYSPTQMKRGYYPPKGTIHTINVEGVPVCAIIKRQSKDASKAYVHVRNHDFYNALPLFLAEHARDSTEEEYTKMIALCYLNIGEPEKALNFIEKTQRLHPEGFMAHYLKGFYYLGQNNLDKAQWEFEQSIKNRINNGDAHAEIGHIYFEKGLYKMAMDKYLTAIGFMNNNPMTYLQLAIAYYNLGDNQNAFYYLQLCMNKHPSYLPAYEKAIEILGQLGDYESQAFMMEQMLHVKELYGLP